MTTPNLQPGNFDIELLSAYLDNQLSAAERAALEQRIEHEPALRSALDELRATVALLRELEPVRPPRSFTLDPQAVAPRRGWSFPWMQLGSGLVAVVFMLAFGFVLAGGSRNSAAPAAAPTAAFAAAEATAAPAPEPTAAPAAPMAAAPAEPAPAAADNSGAGTAAGAAQIATTGTPAPEPTPELALAEAAPTAAAAPTQALDQAAAPPPANPAAKTAATTAPETSRAYPAQATSTPAATALYSELAEQVGTPLAAGTPEAAGGAGGQLLGTVVVIGALLVALALGLFLALRHRRHGRERDR